MPESSIIKPKFVIFEGPDKVGKTTLFRGFRSHTHFIPLAIDRFTGSNYVYDIFYKRRTELDKYLDVETNIQEALDCYLICLTASEEVLYERIIKEETGTALSLALDNFRIVKGLFTDYFFNKTRYNKKILIKTDGSTTEYNLKKILDFTGELIGAPFIREVK